MENNFKRKLMAFWLFLWVGIPFMLAQSPMMISGRITDDLGEPMIGVSVLEKGTSNGVITKSEQLVNSFAESKSKTNYQL